MEERRAAGLLLDQSTAEIDWTYAQTLDPYGDGLPLLPQEDQRTSKPISSSNRSNERTSEVTVRDKAASTF
jgi:hypothetical protein